ncbi:MAG TPA: DUF3027 domain-containing protein [Marmoricola sp.]|nr:DUF3027 domain-containing protein [Marmoricola sp.]
MNTPALPATDEIAAATLDAARTAVIDQVGATEVGEHLGFAVEDEFTVSHMFACTKPGYPGWHWTVTVVRVPGSESTTVDEVVLLPGSNAILAPAWVPWRERIKPGDLSPGDILPTDEDDLRLVPGYFAGDDDTTPRSEQKSVADEVGLGRSRVLSPDGRLMAAERWQDGDFGPGSPLAQSAAHACATCGFMIRLAGPLSARFAVCANEYANADGHVVALDHGCGAHSEAQLRRKQLPPPVPDPHHDTLDESEDLELF